MKSKNEQYPYRNVWQVTYKILAIAVLSQKSFKGDSLPNEGYGREQTTLVLAPADLRMSEVLENWRRNDVVALRAELIGKVGTEIVPN